MRTNLMIAALVAAISIMPVVAKADGMLPKDTPLTQGPAAHDVESPYKEALQCMASALTPLERQESFAVLSLPDKTGKVNYVADSGTGDFSTQAGSDRLITALKQAGVKVIEEDPEYRNLVDWYLPKEGASLAGDGNDYHLRLADGTVVPTKPNALPVLTGHIMMPNFVISGSISSLDFMPGEGVEGTVMGIGGGYREYGIVVAIDAKVATMPVAQTFGGVVLSSRHVAKQMVAREYKAGTASIFGTTFVDIDLGSDKREPLQLAEGFMLDKMAYELVADTFRNHTCDQYIAYADTVAPKSHP